MYFILLTSLIGLGLIIFRPMSEYSTNMYGLERPLPALPYRSSMVLNKTISQLNLNF